MSTLTHHFRSLDRAEGFVSGVEFVNDGAVSVMSPGVIPCPWEAGCFDVKLEDDDTGDFDIHGDLGYGLTAKARDEGAERDADKVRSKAYWESVKHLPDRRPGYGEDGQEVEG